MRVQTSSDLTVLVAGGSTLRQEGLVRLLCGVPDVGIVATVNPGATVPQAVAYARPDLVLLPLRMANTGLERLAKRVRVVVIAEGRVRHGRIAALAELGVAGVLDASCGADALAEAVTAAIW